MSQGLPESLQHGSQCGMTQPLRALAPLKSGLFKTCIFYSWQGIAPCWPRCPSATHLAKASAEAQEHVALCTSRHDEGAEF